MDEDLNQLRRTAIQKIRELARAIKEVEEPKEEEAPGAIKGLVNDIQTFVEKQPLESAASAAVLGAITEQIAESMGILKSDQFGNIKVEAQRIIRRTAERLVADALEQGLTLAAIPLANMFMKKSTAAEPGQTTH